MGELKGLGIVLKSSAHKDNDKLCEIFMLDYGRINAVFRGALKPKAKMRAYAQPFCFAEFELVKRGDFYTVSGVSEGDLFMGLSESPERYYAAFSLIGGVELFTKYEQPAPNLFLLLLKMLKSLCYGGAQPSVVVLKFYLRMLDLSGYGLNFDKCCDCGGRFTVNVNFSLRDGGFSCGLCNYGQPMEMPVFRCLQLVELVDEDKVETLKADSENTVEALRFLGNYMYIITTETVKGLREFINLQR